MAGIYIHIPFCKKACHYCNFHFSTSLKQKNAFVAALLKENRLRKAYLQNQPVETIYFGGGTPSLLEASEMEAILTGIRENHQIANNPEITVEANPDDIKLEKLQHWIGMGVNRVSLGVQSFHNNDLIWMNRAHSAEQAETAIRMIQAAGIQNITIDLIYGVPGLSDEKWMENLEKAYGLNIPHLSCYALTVEPKTALEGLIRKKKLTEPSNEDQARQFNLLMDWAEHKGYEQYEISNFAKKGFRSRHNSSYWQDLPYLGLGPSAHSYNGAGRQWNLANNALYIQGLEQEIVPYEIETLSETQRLNEYIMTSTRTIEGIDLEYVNRNFGEEAMRDLTKRAEGFIAEGKVQFTENRLILTRAGKLFADGIASELFV